MATTSSGRASTVVGEEREDPREPDERASDRAESADAPDESSTAEVPADATDLSGPPASESPTPLALDDVFHVLQNERRRQVLYHLREADGTVEMREVAEHIAAWENDTTVEELYSDQRQRVYIALYQSHLPKLDELGIVEYDQARGTVEPTDRLDSVIDHLEAHTPGSDASVNADPFRRWTRPVLYAGAVAALIAMATTLGVFLLTPTGIGIAIAMVGLTAAAAVGCRELA